MSPNNDSSVDHQQKYFFAVIEFLGIAWQQTIHPTPSILLHQFPPKKDMSEQLKFNKENETKSEDKTS